MAIVVVVAAVAAAVVAVFALLVRQARRRVRRGLEHAILQLEESFARIGDALEQALERVEEAPAATVSPELSLDLDDMLLGIAHEAAARTGAGAAAIRVRGPGDDPAVASVGADDLGPLLEETLRTPQGRAFRALTINWTLPSRLEADRRTFRSALVVPLLEDGVETGAIAGYATQSAAFRPEHARALEALATEAAERITIARRLTVMKQRAAAAQGEQRPAQPQPSDRLESTGAGGDS
jgi:hypothetical protein